ncbi:hypothetical protein PTSG_08178 [Salpingoeca rosetta]|uniref:Tyrosine specific protein phosphatases domain-containing protein n=1 Tax=Salpingoeca rosetta (strain ATCC 50818 / BSB-021) TaxID=946362 RepID=F2UI82_SALR5|nr:uncharacterized protein PTSG_08178 [Salpingoeca rosetta]EGD76831.1 hypothetical protein PTSG_08178 [Salpingoeca rosetta]|eukprot:XP_004991203.1 hypothetical protein PTSG_08178 [Salpingoeca rosetta]
MSGTSSKVHVNDKSRDASAEFRKLREDVKAFGFSGVSNLRDISILDSRIRPGLVFRSGTPSDADASDFIKLVLGIGLTTIVDLRDQAEDAKDEGERSLLRVFSRTQHKHIEEIDHANPDAIDAIVANIFADTKAKPKYVEDRRPTLSDRPSRQSTSHSPTEDAGTSQQDSSGSTGNPTSSSSSSSSPKTWRRHFRRLGSTSLLSREGSGSPPSGDTTGDASSSSTTTTAANATDTGADAGSSSSASSGAKAPAPSLEDDEAADPEAVLESGALDDPTSPLAELTEAALSLESGNSDKPVDEARQQSLDAQIDEFIQTSEPIPRVKYYIPLAEKKTMAIALISAVSMRDRLKVAGQYLVGATIDKAKKHQAKMHMMKKFDDMGLFGLNKIILRYSQTSLCRVLKIVATARHHPVLVHCFHGKDRTGLVIALILRLLGVPAQKIADDYHLSEEHGMSPAGRAHFEKVGGLTVDKWCVAPRRVIIETLKHIDAEYHGIKAYCEQIGFGDAWQRRLKQTLLLPQHSQRLQRHQQQQQQQQQQQSQHQQEQLAPVPESRF